MASDVGKFSYVAQNNLGNFLNKMSVLNLPQFSLEKLAKFTKPSIDLISKKKQIWLEIINIYT